MPNRLAALARELATASPPLLKALDCELAAASPNKLAALALELARALPPLLKALLMESASASATAESSQPACVGLQQASNTARLQDVPGSGRASSASDAPHVTHPAAGSAPEPARDRRSRLPAPAAQESKPPDVPWSPLVRSGSCKGTGVWGKRALVAERLATVQLGREKACLTLTGSEALYARPPIGSGRSHKIYQVPEAVSGRVMAQLRRAWSSR